MSNDPRRDDLAGDRAVDAAWRRASDELPSARADATILAAARAASRSVTPQPPATAPRWRWNRWQPLAAAAGVAILAFLLVPRTQHEEPVVARPQAASRLPAAKESAVATDGAMPEVATPPPSAAPPEERVRSPAPPPPPAVSAERGVAVPAPSGPEARATAAPAAAAESAPAALGPAQWVDRIAALHAAGDQAGAAAALEQFRRSYADADARLPPTLQAWAATVPRSP